VETLPSTPAVILAIDPGLSGAVCRLGARTLDLRRDFKTLPDIAHAVHDLSAGVTHTVIELVHAMPGQGVCSMFSFGRATGVADGALALCFNGLIVEEVAPLRWQNFFRKHYDMGRDWQFDSRALALRLFPAHANLFKRVKDHNSADAVLLAVWKARQLSALSP
jgi:hypothetical protein